MNTTEHPNPILFSMVSTHSSSHYTPVALKSFRETTQLDPYDTFLLIQNDGAPHCDLSQLPSRGEILLNSEPKSFAQNMNTAVKRALTHNQDLVFLNNDLVFTPRWVHPIRSARRMILSPLSNREINYQTETFKTSVVMTLDDYYGHEETLKALADAHRNRVSGIMRVFTAPFFAIFIPFEILQTVGLLDESYGRGGGEDYDYCLRAILAGFSVGYAQSSFILHFGGKSTYAGAETQDQQKAREEKFFRRSREKWGESLFQFCLKENLGVVTQQRELSEQVDKGDYRAVVTSLCPSLPPIQLM